MAFGVSRQKLLCIEAIIACLIGLTYLGVYAYQKQNDFETTIATLESKLKSSQETVVQKDAEIAQYGANLEELKQAYALSEENGAELLGMLTEEKDRNDEFEEQIDDLTGTVGKLDKLSKIDPELLQKYSKVYFLNEHYMPEKLKEISSEFRFKTEEPEYIHARIITRLESMLDDAKDDGAELLVVSGFRSFDEQKSLKNAYTTVYGTGANAFSADQGYSEHQLGTTIDFTTTAIGGSLNGFENTASYAWLQKNAHKYGFVLSYPKDNSYYTFEPWHWRFVGEDLAGDLHRDGEFFYDLEQREIDEYLIKLFD